MEAGTAAISERDRFGDLGLPLPARHQQVEQNRTRLFSFITQNWRGKPLVSHEVIVNLIAATKTKAGLQVKSRLDTRKYPKGVKVSKEEYATIRLNADPFHGDWNYSISPT